MQGACTCISEKVLPAVLLLLMQELHVFGPMLLQHTTGRVLCMTRGICRWHPGLGCPSSGRGAHWRSTRGPPPLAHPQSLMPSGHSTWTRAMLEI